MELKYKEQKIRDLFVYNTNIFPVAVDINRHDVTVTVRSTDIQREGFTSEGVVKHISRLTGRKLILNIIEED